MNANFSTVITTTLQNHGNKIFDAVTTNNALLSLLKKKGNIKVVSGGYEFTHPLIYGKNASFKSYPKLGVIETPNTDNITRAVYAQKVVAGSLVLSTLEVAQNAGNREKLLDLTQVKKMEAEISMTEVMGDQVFASGAVATDFDGLPYLINLSPSTQTDVGNINSTTYSYWRNQVDTTGTSGFNSNSAGVTLMNSMLNSCTFGLQGPNAIITTKTVYGLYEIGLTSLVRYQRTDLGDLGFRYLAYTTMPMMFDDNCATGYMYFVDTDSLWLQVLARGNMEITNFEWSHNQLSRIALMYIFGNLTCGSRRTQGLLTSITA